MTMDLPDPAELFDYYSRLHDAGFGDVTARVIVAAAATGYAQSNTVELAASWVDVVSRCDDACPETHTFDDGRGIGTPPGKATPEEVEEATPHSHRPAAGKDRLVLATRGLNLSTLIRCEPSHLGQLTYLFVDGGHSVLSRDETILLRDTLTAILKGGS